MKRFLSIMLAFAVLISLMATTASIAAEENEDDEYKGLNDFCSSSEFSSEELAKRYPDYYQKCQEAYARDLKDVEEIEANIDELLAIGAVAARDDAKQGEETLRGESLGTVGDIIVALRKYNDDFPVVGHAGIVARDYRKTIESHPKSASPIDVDGVATYTNDWGSRHGSLLVRPKNVTTQQYLGAADFAASKIGCKYNWNFFNTTTTKRYYCSQLVWQAWKSVGVNTNVGTFPDGIVSPADLVNSDTTYVVRRVQ